jgi:hypothetical protein
MSGKRSFVISRMGWVGGKEDKEEKADSRMLLKEQYSGAIAMHCRHY